MRRFQICLSLGVACFFGFLRATSAQSPFSARAGQNSAEVRCGSQVVLRLRAPAGHRVERAQSVAQRLHKAVLGSGRAEEVRVETSDNKSFVISLRDQPLLTVTRADARATGSTPAGLAAQWAQNVRDALSQPLIAMSDVSLLIALGEQGKASFGATVAGVVTAEAADASIASVQLDAEQKALRVTGRGVGKTTVQLRCGDATAQVAVTVKKRAGRLNGETVAYLFNASAPQPIVERAVLNAILTSAQLEPGSTLSVRLDALRSSGAPTGNEGSLRVPVKILGPNYLPFQINAGVSLQPRPLPKPTVQALVVSNAPENVARPTLLRETMLSPRKPCRLLYHHKNAGAAPMDLVVELVNLNEQDADVAVIEGNGGAASDEMGVGHRAAVSFLTFREGNVGYYARVPAEQTYRLAVHRLPPQWTASGLLELCPAGSLPVMVRVRALPAGAGETRLVPTEPDLHPQDTPNWTFPQVVKSIEAAYRVGERWTFIPFGRTPVRSADGKRAWDGNFGVTYIVTARITNPSSVTTPVEFVFEPVAGVATGTFVVGDRIIESSALKPPHEYVFYTVSLAPQETRTVTFLALPESGSNYPANLVVRSK